MRTALLVALCVSATLASTVASADDKAACLAATQQAQSLRDAHKLVEAREHMRFQATHDSLTSLLNRGVIMDLLGREIADHDIAARYERVRALTIQPAR